MKNYTNSPNRAASGKNNQSSFAKATEDKQTNQQSSALADAYKELGYRECQVLELIIEGKENREIADTLFISTKTVENHITSIGKKLDCSGKGQLRKKFDR